MRSFAMADRLRIDALQRLQRCNVCQHRRRLLLCRRRRPVKIVITSALLLPHLLLALDLLPQSFSDRLAVHCLFSALALGPSCLIRVSVVNLILLLLVEVQERWLVAKLSTVHLRRYRLVVALLALAGLLMQAGLQVSRGCLQV